MGRLDVVSSAVFPRWPANNVRLAGAWLWKTSCGPSFTGLDNRLVRGKGDEEYSGHWRGEKRDDEASTPRARAEGRVRGVRGGVWRVAPLKPYEPIV